MLKTSSEPDLSNSENLATNRANDDTHYTSQLIVIVFVTVVVVVVCCSSPIDALASLFDVR